MKVVTASKVIRLPKAERNQDMFTVMDAYEALYPDAVVEVEIGAEDRPIKVHLTYTEELKRA